MELYKTNNAIQLIMATKLLWVSLIFTLVFFCGNPAFAQDDVADKLITKISLSTSDTERLILMDELTAELISSDLKEALVYARKSLNLSQEIGDPPKEAQARYRMGSILFETQERSSSLEYFAESERMAEELRLEELQARNLMSIARYYRYAAFDSTKTVNNFLKSAEISERIDFHWGAGRSYAKLASFYTKYNKIDLCENYLKLSAKHYIQHPNAEKTIAHYYTEVGDKIWQTNPKKAMDLYFQGKEYKLIPSTMVSLAKAHLVIGENEVALSYLEDAIPFLGETEQRKRMLGTAISQLAEVYMQQGKYQAANKACDKGIALLIKLGRSDQKALPDFYRIKGILLENQGQEKEALRYFTLSIDEARRIKNEYSRINSTLALGNYYRTRDSEKAEFYCKKAYDESRKREFIGFEMESCDCLYSVNKSKGSYLEALNFHEQKIMLSDSLNTRTVGHALDVNNMMAEKDKLIGEQSFQKRIREKEMKNQNILILSLSVIMLIGLLFFGNLVRNHKKVRKVNMEINNKTHELLKANRKLERSNEELERFAHIASHDLKTPVRSIVSFTGLLRRKLKNEENPDVSDLLDFIESGGKRMNRLIADVLEFSQLTGEVTVAKEIIDLNQLTREIAQLQTTSKSEQATIEIGKLPHIKWFHSRVYLLIKNLIENGIKYNKSEYPTIKIYAKSLSGMHSVYIEDNGIGISSEYFENIFKMFNRLHTDTEYEGSGLGLASCKKIVNEFEGKITVISEVDHGSIFRIDFPEHLVHQPQDSYAVMESGEILV